MAEIRVGELRWPLITVRYPEECEPSEFRALFERYGVLSQRAEREQVQLVYLIDFSHFNHLLALPTMRRYASEVYHEYLPMLRETTAAEARVAPSVGARTVLKAFDWLAQQPWPCRNFSSEDGAVAWLEGHMMYV